MPCSTCGVHNSPNASACLSCGTPLKPTAPSSNLLAPGSTLLGGTYTIGKPLGQGGFGITYLGSDVRLQRPVAIMVHQRFGLAQRHVRPWHRVGAVSARDGRTHPH